MYRIIIFFAICFSYVSLQAGDAATKAQVDATTYRLYIEGNWKELIELGKEAQKAGIDFYYLQLRMGTAYFHLKNYRMAAKYFQTAYQTDPTYEYTRQMLENALIYSGNNFELNRVAKMDKINTSKYLNVSNIKNWQMLAEGGRFTDNDAYSLSQNTDAIKENTTIAAEKSVSTTYSQVTLQRYLGGNFSFGLGYTYVLHQQTALANGSELANRDLRTTQNQIYSTITAAFGAGISLKVSGQYIKQQSRGEVFDSGILTSDWTDYASFDSISQGGRYTISVFDTIANLGYAYADFYPLNSHQKDYALDIHLKKATPYFAFGVGYALGRLNRWQQQQINASLDVYPFGNLNTYYHGYYSYRITNEPETDPGSAILLNSLVGQKLHRYLWAEVYYHYGTINNYIDESAYHIFNGMHKVINRMGVSFIIPLKNVSITLGYQYQVKENSAFGYQYSSETEREYRGQQTVITTGPQNYYSKAVYPYVYRNNIGSKTNTAIRYSNHLINGGIIWRF